MDSPYSLLRSQKNQVFELVKRSGLDPFNFQWVSRPSLELKRGSAYAAVEIEILMEALQYEGTNHFFSFDRYDKGHLAVYSPGKEELIAVYKAGSWAEQKLHFRTWLISLKKEINEPDMWAELSKYQIPPGEEIRIDDVENTPLTYSEVSRIAEGINQVRTYLEGEFKATANERRLINEKLDYLLEAAKRQGRKDWMHTCVGALVSLTIQLVLSPEQTKIIWGIIKTTVSGIIRFLQQ